ncbi:beta-N-acetylhexosaminidase [Sphingosinicella terrae]|uniref:beta-N-acetylhexosaminidase n=1 Tax=Sphingosinicella terrae TaxID=2172047 RepID=UPI000E0DA00B|nr:beta-N-acetylhexosaminidase [Sphingosinicella terrae]
MLPVIFGLESETLGAEERAFFADADPAGYILFGRNIRDRGQLRRLTDDLRSLAGRTDLPILVDQEGGRVARLGPPEWPVFPAPDRFCLLYRKAPISAIEAARLNALAMAVLLAEVGINVDCTPVLDLRHELAHTVISDRSLGSDPLQVAALGRAVLDGLEEGGVCGIVKHMPGHGRAKADSHEALPRIDADEQALAVDLAPFRALSDAPMAMTAHLLFTAWDEGNCATLSPTIINEVIRTRIGFDGLLISDDLSMGALAGPPEARARAAIAAGCDVVLHGPGAMAENERIAAALAPIGSAARDRLDRALARIAGRSASQDYDALAARRDALLAYA